MKVLKVEQNFLLQFTFYGFGPSFKRPEFEDQKKTFWGGPKHLVPPNLALRPLDRNRDLVIQCNNYRMTECTRVPRHSCFSLLLHCLMFYPLKPPPCINL